MIALLKLILYAVIFYYCFIFLSRLIAGFFLKKWMNKIKKDFDQKPKTDFYKKHHDDETEVSYKKDNNIDPGGDYVDFEDLSNEK